MGLFAGFGRAFDGVRVNGASDALVRLSASGGLVVHSCRLFRMAPRCGAGIFPLDKQGNLWYN